MATPASGGSAATGSPHPYSPACAACGLAFVSGALSIDNAGKAVSGRVEALDAAIARMTERLATVGDRLQDTVKLTYFVTDVSLCDEANRQFEKIFSAPRPARAFVEVSRLPRSHRGDRLHRPLAAKVTGPASGAVRRVQGLRVGVFPACRVV